MTNGSASPWVTYSPWTPVAERTARRVEIEQLSSLAAELVDWHSSDFLGSYVDLSNKVIVVAGSAKGMALATAQFAGNPEVVVRRASVTIASVGVLGDSLLSLSSSLRDGVIMWGGDPQNDGMFVTINTEPTETDRQTIEDFAAANRVPIHVEIAPGLGRAKLLSG